MLTDDGKNASARCARCSIDTITDKIMNGLPLWADLPTGKALSRNAAKGKKAFALAGQRIYIGGLDRDEIEKEGIDWQVASALWAPRPRAARWSPRSWGASSARKLRPALGHLPDGRPGQPERHRQGVLRLEDMLADEFPDKDPTSLLVWTLKAKTVADPIGNEEQLLNEDRKGALVDLRPGPHDVVEIRRNRKNMPLRKRNGRCNRERAFSDVGNFATTDDGEGIAGNAGEDWPLTRSKKRRRSD